MSDSSTSGPVARGPVSRNPVSWTEVSGKKITLPSGATEIAVVLVIGETGSESQPIFCLNIKEKAVNTKCKWYSHSVTLNKSECDWILNNIEQLTPDNEAKHTTTNKAGENTRSLRLTLSKTVIFFQQTKNGRSSDIIFPKSRVGLLTKYIAEAIDDYNKHVQSHTERTEQIADEE